MKKFLLSTVLMTVGAVGTAYWVIRKADKIALGLERVAHALNALAGYECSPEDMLAQSIDDYSKAKGESYAVAMCPVPKVHMESLERDIDIASTNFCSEVQQAVANLSTPDAGAAIVDQLRREAEDNTSADSTPHT